VHHSSSHYIEQLEAFAALGEESAAGAPQEATK
jgi:hypothetical protein